MDKPDRVMVKVSRRFTAPAERVFDAWLDPKTASQFLFTRPGQTIIRAEIDARVGGSFLFVARRDGQDFDHVGKYLEINRPSRLVFTLCVPMVWSEDNRVVIEIVPLDPGCELTLTHEAAMPELAERLRGGWSSFLEGLDALINKTAPRP